MTAEWCTGCIQWGSLGAAFSSSLRESERALRVPATDAPLGTRLKKVATRVQPRRGPP